MDILIFILAVCGVFLIPSLVGAGVADAVKGSGKETRISAKSLYMTKEERLKENMHMQAEIVEFYKKGIQYRRCTQEYARYIIWLYNHRPEE